MTNPHTKFSIWASQQIVDEQVFFEFANKQYCAHEQDGTANSSVVTAMWLFMINVNFKEWMASTKLEFSVASIACNAFVKLPLTHLTERVSGIVKHDTSVCISD